jgi:methylenetetrahydrofolate reductase (NADPH)
MDDGREVKDMVSDSQEVEHGIQKALQSGKFVVTSEVAPPKGTNLDKMGHHIELLRDKVDALNVTDHQSSVMRYPSLGGALVVKEMGGSPSCR